MIILIISKSKYLIYNFLISSLGEIIPKLIIRIKKHKLNEGLKEYIDKFCLQEFEILDNLIDNDELHKCYLDQPNNLLRYKDIRTYQYNKVYIEHGNQYINASWIHFPFPGKFIATQGPIPRTIEDFWIMCNKYEVETIVMLCNFKEKNVEKCAYYLNLKNRYFEITNMYEQEIDNGIILRKFKLINYYEKIVNNISQIHLTCWDDHTALNSAYFDKIIKIINFIDQNGLYKTVVVHCSAGVGRTGTFISLYNLYHEIKIQIESKNKEIIEFSVFNLVRKIKELRMHMVENENQYILLYQFINFLLLKFNS